MKILAILSLFLSASAWAGSWVSVEVERANLLYLDGEKANFSIRVVNAPTNPAFEVKASVEQVGQGSPVEVELNSGVGAYASPSLAPGNPTFRFVARIVGPGGWERVVEQQDFQLQVNDLE